MPQQIVGGSGGNLLSVNADGSLNVVEPYIMSTTTTLYDGTATWTASAVPHSPGLTLDVTPSPQSKRSASILLWFANATNIDSITFLLQMQQTINGGSYWITTQEMLIYVDVVSGAFRGINPEDVRTGWRVVLGNDIAIGASGASCDVLIQLFQP